MIIMALRRLIILSCFTACSAFAWSQNYITVSGKVFDAETKETLVFASIGLQGKTIGTISNTIGEFDFHIPEGNISGILEINMLGYESFLIPLSEVIEQKIREFPLQRKSNLLDEVVISDSLTGEDIFTIAVNRIDQNYADSPFMLDAFYRDIKSVGGTYVALLEAAIKVYDRNYKNPRQKMRLREKVALEEVRKSIGYDNKFTTFFDQTNLLEDLLLHNNVRYRQFPGADNKEFISRLERADVDFYKGKRIFLIKLKDSERLKFYIDAENYAFLRIEYSLGKSSRVIDRKGRLTSRLNSLKKILEFKEVAGKMHLSHMDVVTVIDWYERKDVVKFQTELHQQLMVNKVYPTTSQRIETTQAMKHFGLQHQQVRYNKRFWDNYNVIKETPLDIAIVKDLEREISLEKQFLKNNR